MSTMSDTETYNGWKNRETWAFNLHWSNDQATYELVLSEARALLASEREAGEEVSDRALGAHIANYVMELLDDGTFHTPEVEQMIRSEVGSWWRIDPTETGAAIRESLSNEGEG